MGQIINNLLDSINSNEDTLLSLSFYIGIVAFVSFIIKLIKVIPTERLKETLEIKRKRKNYLILMACFGASSLIFGLNTTFVSAGVLMFSYLSIKILNIIIKPIVLIIMSIV